jgi:hypothetical protein
MKIYLFKNVRGLKLRGSPRCNNIDIFLCGDGYLTSRKNLSSSCAMDKFSIAMGITFLNRAPLSMMTLAQMAGESKSTT